MADRTSSGRRFVLPPAVSHASGENISRSARVFLDTEFTDLTPDARLISLGAVSADGQEFYAELADGWVPQFCSEFVRQTVVPLLELPSSARLTQAQCATHFVRWLEGIGAGFPFVVVTVDSCIDWWMLGLLIDGEGWTPGQSEVSVGWSEAQLSLRVQLAHWSHADTMARFRHALEDSLKGLRRHHALDDARALRRAWSSICK